MRVGAPSFAHLEFGPLGAIQTAHVKTRVLLKAYGAVLTQRRGDQAQLAACLAALDTFVLVSRSHAGSAWLDPDLQQVCFLRAGMIELILSDAVGETQTLYFPWPNDADVAER